MSTQIQLYVIRHGEKTDSIKNFSGLTIQGGVRAYHYNNSGFVQNLAGHASYDIYTYAETKNGNPTSRAYYTVKPMMDANKSGGINHVASTNEDFADIRNVLCQTDSPCVLIAWEHGRIQALLWAILQNSELSSKNQKKVNNQVPNYPDLINPAIKKATKQTFSKEAEYQLTGVSETDNQITINGSTVALGDPSDRAANNAAAAGQNFSCSDTDDVGYAIMYHLDLTRDTAGNFALNNIEITTNFAIDMNSTKNNGFTCTVGEFGK